MRWSRDWYIQNAEKNDAGDPIPLFDLFVNTGEVGDLKIFQVLSAILNTDIPIIATTRTVEKIEITFVMFCSMKTD